LETFVGGVNGLPNANATPTSYYLKKYVDGTTQISGNGENSFYHVWVTFRLAEFYLNYAEALLNLSDKSGFSMTATQAINTVRKRAGLADLSDAQVTLEACKKERFVELAFEGHRFFDVRRWKEGAKYFTTIYGLDITRSGDSFTETKKVVQNRQWDESKMNFFPIPQSEILKAGSLEQNPGWN
jgi:hypothetical protein